MGLYIDTHEKFVTRQQKGVNNYSEYISKLVSL